MVQSICIFSCMGGRPGISRNVCFLPIIIFAFLRDQVTEEKKKLNIPETVNEGFMSDASDDEGMWQLVTQSVGFYL